MATVIVSKDGTGAELVEKNGLRIEISHPDGLKRKQAELVFSRFRYYKYTSWKNCKFGWTAEFALVSQERDK